MSGTYTDITELTVQSSAQAGSVVPVTMTIKNKYTSRVYVAAIAVRDSVDRFIDWVKVYIDPGVSQQFSGSFIMPAANCVVNAYSYYLGDDGYWHLDDERSESVSLSEAVADFNNIEITSWSKV